MSEKRKSNEISDTLRSEGNKFYAQRKFFEALLKYNESLCFAENETENLGLVFANRSAVYLEMKLFANCLRNIDLAKQHRYPEKNAEILKNRQEKCEKLMKDSKNTLKDPWSFFKLSHPPNKKLPFIANCLEVNHDKKYGRFITTNKQLRVGDVIAVEEPFCRVLLSESNFHEVPGRNIYQRCCNCLKENALYLIPCDGCCKAMFCSETCKEVAQKRYHKYECPIMIQLLSSGSVHMALRLLFIALSTFNGSFKDLEIFFDENCGKSLTIFDSQENSEEKNLLSSLLSLVRSSKLFSLQQHENILKSHPKFVEIFEPHKDFLRKFLLTVCQISDSNFHGIFSGSSQENLSSDPKRIFSSMQQSIGSGSLLFGSLINHSCCNNVLRVCVEGKVVLIVCRPIPKGSQLFDCYKVNFMKHPKPERQTRLLKEFGFMCDCEACTLNYPTPPALPFKDAKLLKFAKKVDEDLSRLQPGQAIKKYRDCCEILEKNNQNYPSLELCMIQKCFATFLLSQAQPSVLFP